MVCSIVIIAGLAAIAVPMISEITDDIHSVERNTGDTFTLTDRTTSCILENTDNGWTMDGKLITEFGTRGIIPMFSDSFVISYDKGSDTLSFFPSVGERTSTATKIVCEDGTYTVTDNGTETTGTYEWILKYSKHGDYVEGGVGSKFNASEEIYIVTAISSSYGVYGGTTNDIEKFFYSGEDLAYTLTTSEYTSKPDVEQVDAFTIDGSRYFLIVPAYYDVIDSTDEMVKMMFNIAPVLLGLMFFAAIGIYMVRNIK